MEEWQGTKGKIRGTKGEGTILHKQKPEGTPITTWDKIKVKEKLINSRFKAHLSRIYLTMVALIQRLKLLVDNSFMNHIMRI